MATIIQGKNEFVYFFIQRKLECVGTGDGTIKAFTVSKKPIADSDLDGTVGVADVEVYIGEANRTGLVAATVTTVDETTGSITLSTAPAISKKVYVSYRWVYGYATYAQEYSVTSELDTKAITPLSSDAEESIETIWKYDGSMKFWDAHDIEEDLMNGVDQSNDTIGGTYATRFPIPSLEHAVVFKKIRDATKKYKVLEHVKVSSLEETGSGGDLSEKSMKLTATGFLRTYTPSAGSGIT